MKSKVIIFGVGQIADVAYDYLLTDSDHEVVAFTVDKEFLASDHHHGLPVCEFEGLDKQFSSRDYHLFMPIGYKKVNIVREERYCAAKKAGYRFISYVSSKANVASNVEIGENCFIMEMNNIQSYSSIGNNTILWSGNHIGHHTAVGEHCFIASHVVISGGVKVGHHSFIGVNATIRDNICIGPRTVIGAGALILKDTPESSVYIGKATPQSRLTSDRLRGI